MGDITLDWERLQLLSQPITSYYRLPEEFQEQIYKFVKQYNVDVLYLHGSYKNGLWHREGVTDKEFIELKKRCYNFFNKPWKENSDLDLLTPNINTKIKYKDLDVMKGVGDVIIYQRPKFI